MPKSHCPDYSNYIMSVKIRLRSPNFVLYKNCFVNSKHLPALYNC